MYNATMATLISIFFLNASQPSITFKMCTSGQNGVDNIYAICREDYFNFPPKEHYNSILVTASPEARQVVGIICLGRNYLHLRFILYHIDGRFQIENNHFDINKYLSKQHLMSCDI